MRRPPTTVFAALVSASSAVALAAGCAGPDPTNGGAGGSAATGVRSGGSARAVTNPTIRLPRSPGTTSPPDQPTPPLALTSFTVGKPEPCANGAGGTSPVTITYAATGADRVVFVVDDLQLPDEPPTSGTFVGRIPCDTDAHYVMIIAVSPLNQTATDKKIVFGGQR